MMAAASCVQRRKRHATAHFIQQPRVPACCCRCLQDALCLAEGILSGFLVPHSVIALPVRRHLCRTASYLAEGIIFLYVGMDALDPLKWQVMR